MKPSLVIYLAFSSIFTSAQAAELSKQDIMQCHQFSGLAAKYQIKKQSGISLEDALKDIETSSEINLAKQIYKDFDQSYSPGLIRRQLFDECAKSFAEYRENERTS
jgi:hypothetical protein